MRKYWVRIGLGAAAVFAAGMFVITLGRQVRDRALDAIRDGGTVRVPLALMPFEVNGARVGSVRALEVQRSGSDQVKRIQVTVHLKGVEADQLEACALTIGDGRHDLFGCVPPAEAEARGMVQVGEVRFEPSGLVRPIMLDRAHVGDWFDEAGAAAFMMHAGPEGTRIRVTDQQGREAVRLDADSNGASLDVRSEDGREVVRLRAGAQGVDLRVKANPPPRNAP